MYLYTNKKKKKTRITVNPIIAIPQYLKFEILTFLEYNFGK